jgi:hypothetical protein
MQVRGREGMDNEAPSVNLAQVARGQFRPLDMEGQAARSEWCTATS